MLSHQTENQRSSLLPWLLGGAAAAAAAWLYKDNHRIEIEQIPVSLPHLPAAFEGFSIALLSDLHIPACVPSPDALRAILSKLKPDAIFLAGDLVTSYREFDPAQLQTYMHAIATVAPCYAVLGNHEKRMGVEFIWSQILTRCGITVLHNRLTKLYCGERYLPLFGAASPLAIPDADSVKNAGLPLLAISHYPAYLPYYAQKGVDLVFSGHAHGGQVRLGNQGILAPGEGLLPRYTSGLYQMENTRMVVSRGLGNSACPIRVFNPPHLPMVMLHSCGY